MKIIAMAPADMLPADTLLTYEDYMAEPDTEGRYDIINGVRIFMDGNPWQHQRTAGNTLMILRHFERATGVGKANGGPFDVLIRRVPTLQTRQPDGLFVSHARIAQGGGIPKKGPLGMAPDLVVEVVSTDEIQRIFRGKIDDYCAAGVSEAWVVRLDEGTVEVMRLTPGGAQSVVVYKDAEAVASVVFPGLTAPVADILAP